MRSVKALLLLGAGLLLSAAAASCGGGGGTAKTPTSTSGEAATTSGQRSQAGQSVGNGSLSTPKVPFGNDPCQALSQAD
ncbi:MAG TPA: hypothetical protein VK821_18310, partial [Dehalococcoidia bacterium]|nr:hypothetical protein [Dehalococcoidia bacterium]